MDDSIASRLVAFLNSRLPRPEQVRAAIEPPAQALGVAGASARAGMGDAIDAAMRLMAGERARPMMPAAIPERPRTTAPQYYVGGVRG